MEKAQNTANIFSKGKNNKLKKETVLVITCTISIILGIAIAHKSTNVIVAFLLCGLSVLFMFKKEYAVYFIIITLFFEAHEFSCSISGARVRISQFIEVIALIIFLILFYVGKIRIKKTPLGFSLWAYFMINLIALKNTDSMVRGIKISILLLSLILFFYLIVNFITTQKIFFRVFNLLLYVGIAEIIYGLYQVFAGMCNYYLQTSLPIGQSGYMHRDFINSPWGRPYGTFVEPDWYGAISLFYSILFIVLYSWNFNKKKKQYLIGMILSLTGLFFSFVRASWIGFFITLILLVFLRHKLNLSKFRSIYLYKMSYIFLFMLSFMLFFSPAINSILESRFTTKGRASITQKNYRYLQSEYAFKSFLKSPILGNGPGSPMIQEGSQEYRVLVQSGDIAIAQEKYNPSIIASVLNDTGVIGMFFFILLFTNYVKMNVRSIPKLESRFQAVTFALFIGILGLFVSYLLTHGLWIPFTWVFLAINTAGVLEGLREQSRDKLF